MCESNFQPFSSVISTDSSNLMMRLWAGDDRGASSWLVNFCPSLFLKGSFYSLSSTDPLIINFIRCNILKRVASKRTTFLSFNISEVFISTTSFWLLYNKIKLLFVRSSWQTEVKKKDWAELGDRFQKFCGPAPHAPSFSSSSSSSCISPLALWNKPPTL